MRLKQQSAELLAGVAFYITAVILALVFSGCATHGTVREVPETAERYRSYGVIWPEDASMNPDHYKTELRRGEMVTTVPATGGTDVRP